MRDNNEFSWTLQAHAVFRWILLVQFGIALAIGFYTQTLTLALLVGAPLIALPIVLSFRIPHQEITKHVVGIATQLMAALHIQQTAGMTEMHFQIFVLLAFLFFFKDWKVVVSSVVIVALHHISFFALQYYQLEGFYAYAQGNVTFYILIIHAVFAVVEGSVLAVMAHKSRQESITSDILHNCVTEIMGSDGRINLHNVKLVDIPALHDFNAMIYSIQSLLSEVHTVVNGLSNSVDRVTLSSSQLDNSVDKQNQQVSDISSSMQSITQNINEVADLSKNSHNMADNAKQSTDQTRKALNESGSSIGSLKSTLQTTSHAIADLSGKCVNISDVMQSIKAVAEQTNLLALNAAIESARAGEHGRGFAVVADEVRNLAIKSKESAEEIEQITSQLTESANGSVSSMNSCVQLVSEAEKSSTEASLTMTSVLSEIDMVNQNVTTVSSSVQKQAVSSESISESAQGLYQMFSDDKVQVDGLKQEVGELNELVGQLNTQLQKFAI